MKNDLDFSTFLAWKLLWRTTTRKILIVLYGYGEYTMKNIRFTATGVDAHFMHQEIQSFMGIFPKCTKIDELNSLDLLVRIE